MLVCWCAAFERSPVPPMTDGARFSPSSCVALFVVVASSHTHTHTQISITKEATIIQGDGSTKKEVEARVKQIRNLAADTEQEYEKEKLNERIARLGGGVAVIQVCVCVFMYVLAL